MLSRRGERRLFRFTACSACTGGSEVGWWAKWACPAIPRYPEVLRGRAICLRVAQTKTLLCAKAEGAAYDWWCKSLPIRRSRARRMFEVTLLVGRELVCLFYF